MKRICTRGLAALFLVVFFLACASMAFSQVAVPNIGVIRKTDTLPKQISETAIAIILNKDGKAVASRPIYDINLPPCELYKGVSMRLNYRLANVVTDTLEATLFPDMEMIGGGKIDKKKASELYDTLKRIDIGGVGRDYKSRQNLYSGILNSLKMAQAGYNSLFLRSITHHANSTEVLAASSTDWRRNFLNSDLSVIVVDDCDKGQLLLMAKANGYRFNDPKVDGELTRLLASQQQPPQTTINEASKGQDDNDRQQDNNDQDNRRNDSGDTDVRGEEPTYKVEFILGGRSCDSMANLTVDQKLEVRVNRDLKVEIYEILKDGEKRLSEMQIPANDYRRLRFRTAGKFQVDVLDGKRLIGTIAVEVK